MTTVGITCYIFCADGIIFYTCIISYTTGFGAPETPTGADYSTFLSEKGVGIQKFPIFGEKGNFDGEDEVGSRKKGMFPILGKGEDSQNGEESSSSSTVFGLNSHL